MALDVYVMDEWTDLGEQYSLPAKPNLQIEFEDHEAIFERIDEADPYPMLADLEDFNESSQFETGDLPLLLSEIKTLIAGFEDDKPRQDILRKLSAVCEAAIAGKKFLLLLSD